MTMKMIWKILSGVAIASSLAAAHVAQAAPPNRNVTNEDGGTQDRSAYSEMSSTKAFHRAGEDVPVNVTFHNNTRAPIAIAKWMLDQDDPDRSFLRVSRNGQPVDYIGAMVKRAAPTADDVVMLNPGQSINVNYELSSSHDLSEGGVYNVNFATSVKHGLGTNVMPSDTISLAVEADSSRSVLSSADYLKAAGAGGVSYTGRCSASQQSSLVSALSSAGTYANGAVNYLNQTPAATARYTTWFGALSTSNWNTVASHYTKIKSMIDTKPIVFDCSCKKSGTYAYVYPNQPYKIYLCGAFWSASLTGTDSKAGTIVHEASHFTVNGGTQDNAYGQSAAKSLAISNPAAAIANADSHEYFAENTPAQP